MNKMIRGISGLFILVLSLAAAAQAPLKTEDITNYIQSLKEMDALSDKLNAEDPEGATAMAQLWLKGDTSEITEHLEGKGYYEELKDAVQRAGFDDVATWVETAQRVTQAYMALELDTQGQDLAAQMKAGLEQIRNNPRLNDEQKATLTEQLKASQVQLSRIEKVSPADRAAVRPYVDELRQQFEPEE